MTLPAVRAAMRWGLAIGPEKSGGEALGAAKLTHIGRGDGQSRGDGTQRGGACCDSGAEKEKEVRSPVRRLVPEGAVLGALPALDRDHAVDEVADKPRLDRGRGDQEKEPLHQAGDDRDQHVGREPQGREADRCLGNLVRGDAALDRPGGKPAGPGRLSRGKRTAAVCHVSDQ